LIPHHVISLFGFLSAARIPMRLFVFSCCIVCFLGMGIKRKRGSVLGKPCMRWTSSRHAGRRLGTGQPEYLIKWMGFDDDKYDTWEGLANLSGLEPDLATFEAQQ